MSDREEFLENRRLSVAAMTGDVELRAVTSEFLERTVRHKYGFNFDWLGLPIIQMPTDILAMQELIWRVRPDVIVETGIARGGSAVFYASMLDLLGGDREVIAVDIDIRAGNREAIEAHPLAHRIHMIEGSSIDQQTLDLVKERVGDRKTVLLVLDSNHTGDHVSAELDLYSPLVEKDSYIVVFDTVIDDLPSSFFDDRPWGPGNNPKTAVHDFLKRTDRFELDLSIQQRLMLTHAPDGWLRCTKD
jgi:cephalosporin hydroxylase